MNTLSSLSGSLLGRFRIVAFLEGCSYLLLGFTMVLKYKYQLPGPNYAVGLTHGGLFIGYVLLLLRVWMKEQWTFTRTGLAFIASLVPFGTFIADKKLFRH